MLEKKFMKLALKLAEKGRGRTSPNPMVGAVIVKNGKVIAKGYHRAFGEAHAEINALKEAGSKARGATMYVTLEPCCFFGKTPPCTEAVIKGGIKKIFIATKDLNPLNNGKGISILRKNKIDVEVGLMADEASLINEVFNKYVTTKMPFVTVKVAQTLDGKIATVTGDSKWISSEGSRKHVHKLRSQSDAIMVGANTITRDDPLLNCRLQTTKADKQKPIKIVLDSNLRISEDARIFSKDSPAPVIMVTTRKAGGEKIDVFRKAGTEVIPALSLDEQISLKWLMRELGRRRITSVLIEGGGETIASALKEKIVDKAIFFIAPKIVGGKSAPTSVAGDGIKQINRALSLKNVRTEKIGPDILVEGYL